ncbi:hypothetical protein [Cobetia sp. QF-1]|uniref:hypothetical protein n=1 Tax=Cobetia sp. QF-1 TaxID=1969833 RepID=UPI0011304470|nr:hypothetical protein [Cobetia sp. QF-1]
MNVYPCRTPRWTVAPAGRRLPRLLIEHDGKCRDTGANIAAIKVTTGAGPIAYISVILSVPCVIKVEIRRYLPGGQACRTATSLGFFRVKSVLADSP